MNLRRAVGKIEKNGILLVFPIDNRREPKSLWYEFFPRSEMKWEWDEEGDTRVSDLWHLRARLSTSRKVIYSKWFRGRATMMSFEFAEALMAYLGTGARGVTEGLSHPAREILDLLEEDSPQSTRMIKRACGLSGRSFERVYESALKELWSRLLISAFGEVDEGAFPSLAIGSTRVLFEDVWSGSQKTNPAAALRLIDRYSPKGSAFRKYVDDVKRKTLSADPEIVQSDGEGGPSARPTPS